LGVVEHRMDLIYQGVVQGELSLERWVETCATTPARMFGLYPRKGTITPGADADVVIYNPNAISRISADTHHMNLDYSCFEGFEINGSVETVLSRGRVVVDDGDYLGSPGDGRYLRRSLSQYLL
ncbi:MAG: amidohydrolase family protein, partial [Acidimicrobiia bacterium]|nr:amidohydrolase family protein [Acidimicrobiia bacterium]